MTAENTKKDKEIVRISKEYQHDSEQIQQAREVLEADKKVLKDITRAAFGEHPADPPSAKLRKEYAEIDELTS